MKAVILVGGEGTRLRPLTYSTVKAMVPVLNKPFIEHLIHYLNQYNIHEIILATGYKPDLIRNYFNGDVKRDTNLIYSVEEIPLGTAGAVKYAEKHIGHDTPFFVLNGDIFTDIDLTDMIRFHRDKKAIATIALTPVEDPTHFGVVETDNQCKVKRFVEKPKKEEVFSNFINAGVYILEPEVLTRIEAGQKSMFEHNIFPGLLADGLPLYGYATSGYWLDMGTPMKYLTANRDLLQRKYSKPFIELPAGNIRVDETCFVHYQSVLAGPLLVGEGCIIDKGAQIIGPSVIGAGCHIGEGAIIENSVLWQGVKVGTGAVIRNSIIANDTRIENNESLDNVVIGVNSGAREMQPVK